MLFQTNHNIYQHMKPFIFFAFYSLTILGCNTNNQQIAKDDGKQYNDDLNLKIDAVIKDYQDLEIFSGVVLVADNGKPIYHKAFGLADRQSKIDNTVNTFFDIGSMNKTFTKIVIKQLVAEGKLKLNDRLTDYIPGFKIPDADKITIVHLLNHTSGFGDYHSPDYFDLPLDQRQLQAIVERAKSTELNFEPGTENDYSNLGYVILGAVIEKVSGRSYFDNVQKRIIEPLDLKHTYLNNFETLTSEIAKGYFYTPLGILEESASIQDVPNPDGGFLSTTLDIMVFYRSYYYDAILISEEMKKIDEEFIELNSMPKGAATGSAGGFDGFNTALYQILSDDQTIIVFANMDEPVAERLGIDILKVIRGKSPSKPKLPAIQNVRKYYESDGITYVKHNFDELTTNYHPTDPKDFILNDLGYAYLYGAGNPVKAEPLFHLNTELFPDIANCWDSYGEVLAKQNKINEAITAYNKALEIRPNLESAEKALQELKSQ